MATIQQMWRLGVIAVLSVGALPAAAQVYKCVGPGGAVTLQQSPCSADTSAGRMKVDTTPSETRPIEIRRALAERRPVVGMTRAELDRVVGGPPDKIERAQDSGGPTREALTYLPPGRTVVAITDDGIVTSVRERERVEYQAPVARNNCPTAEEIRELEIEKNKYKNRDDYAWQFQLALKIKQAKDCRP